MKWLSCFLFCSFFITQNPFACSAFMLKTATQVLVFKNFDWHQEDAYILTNPKGIVKKAFPTNGTEAQWVAKYTSLTINQYGKEFPIEGVNEKGLVVQTLILPEAYYSKNEQKTSVNELQFVQYQLDNFESVESVLRHLEDIIVIPVTANVHYFLADKTGNAAVIDYINGKLNISQKIPQNNQMALSNSPYIQTMGYAKNNLRIRPETHSLNRFCNVQNAVELIKNRYFFPIDSAFQILELVKVKSTKWMTGYDLTNQMLYFKTASKQVTRRISYSNLDFSKTTFLQLSNDEEKNLETRFRAYSAEDNFNLIQKTFQYIKVPQVQNNLDIINQYQMSPEKAVATKDITNTGTLIIKVIGLNQNKGVLRIAYVNSKARYKAKDFNDAVVILPENKQATWVLYNLPFGEYVFGLHHDINGDDKFNSFLGIPKEPFGFSNNAKGILGFPKYKKAKIEVLKTEQEIVIRCK